MKKEKKATENKDFVLGKKLKSVKMNEKQHFLLFVSMLILFNLILAFSVGFILIYLDFWYNWVICFAFLILSFALSFKYYRDTKIFNKCELYDNALVMNSIWFNFKVEFKYIYEMRVKVSALDKFFKLNTKSLEIKILGHKRKKFTLHFIEENAVNLKHEITILIDKYTERTEQENKKTSAN
jgi:hypothetical protein